MLLHSWGRWNLERRGMGGISDTTYRIWRGWDQSWHLRPQVLRSTHPDPQCPRYHQMALGRHWWWAPLTSTGCSGKKPIFGFCCNKPGVMLWRCRRRCSDQRIGSFVCQVTTASRQWGTWQRRSEVWLYWCRPNSTVPQLVRPHRFGLLRESMGPPSWGLFLWEQSMSHAGRIASNNTQNPNDRFLPLDIP